MNIVSYDLKANGLERLPFYLKYKWEIVNDSVRPLFDIFPWQDGKWFEGQIFDLSSRGVTGVINIIGEKGDWRRYVLVVGGVAVYEKESIYDPKSNKVWRKEKWVIT